MRNSITHHAIGFVAFIVSVAISGAFVSLWRQSFDPHPSPIVTFAGANEEVGVGTVAKATSDLALAISPAEMTVQAGESIRLSIKMSNTGQRPVLLVQPGEGSDVGWRTPIMD